MRYIPTDSIGISSNKQSQREQEDNMNQLAYNVQGPFTLLVAFRNTFLLSKNASSQTTLLYLHS